MLGVLGKKGKKKVQDDRALGNGPVDSDDEK